MSDYVNLAGARWWSKLLGLSSLLAVLLLLVGPLSYRYGLVELAHSLTSILVACCGAVLILLVSLVMVVIAHKNSLIQDRNLLILAMVLSLMPIIMVTPYIITANSVPPIHDISTDTQNPPQFSAIVPLRVGATNDLVYELEGSIDKLAKAQRLAYPEVQPLITALAMPMAITRATEVLAHQGLDIVNSDKQAGLVEATATTFWFGFKDDIVVRIRARESGSIVDVRSVSRIGQSDIGANATRIMAFLEAF